MDSGADQGRDPLLLLPALWGALAVLTGATALVPLLDGTSWLLSLAEIVAVIYLIGAAARLLRLPGWGVMLLQLGGLAVTLTSLYTVSGIGGVLPGPTAIGDAATMLRAAWHDVMVTVPPAPVGPDMALLVGLCIGIIALLVDIMITGTETPALVALPLLGLYSVPASIAHDMLPWYAFVVPAVCYIALLAGGAPGRPGHGSGRSAIATSAIGIGAVTIVGALLVTDAATSIGTEGRIPRHSSASGDVDISPWAHLRGDLTGRTSVDTLQVSGLSDPAYLRTFALEKWDPDEGFGLGKVSADASDLDGALPGAQPSGADRATVAITPQHYRSRYLPLYLGATSVRGLPPGWDYDRGLATAFRSSPVTPDGYDITVNTAKPTAAELRAENVHSGGPLTETGNLPIEVTNLARKVTADAETPFDAVDALLHYFTDPANGFSYSLATPLGNSDSALLDFLHGRKGYCEQYAASMAIMARSVGIPARVGIGFTQGKQLPDGNYQVTSTNAHAWVEVKFDKSGWVAFDPTPPVGGQGGLQGFVEAGDNNPDDDVSDSAAAPATGAPSTAPSAAPSARAAAPSLGTKIPAESTSGSETLTGQWPLWVVPAVLLLLALLTMLPSLVRRRRRRRRMATVAQGGARAGTAAWDEITDTLTDHGQVTRPHDSARSTAEATARLARLRAEAREALTTIVGVAEHEWYSGSPARQDPATAQEMQRGVRRVIDGLDDSRPRSSAERIWPRSLRRRTVRHRAAR